MAARISDEALAEGLGYASCNNNELPYREQTRAEEKQMAWAYKHLTDALRELMRGQGR